jgi:hypothetical protein
MQRERKPATVKRDKTGRKSELAYGRRGEATDGKTIQRAIDGGGWKRPSRASRGSYDIINWDKYQDYLTQSKWSRVSSKSMPHISAEDVQRLQRDCYARAVRLGKRQVGLVHLKKGVQDRWIPVIAVDRFGDVLYMVDLSGVTRLTLRTQIV